VSDDEDFYKGGIKKKANRNMFNNTSVNIAKVPASTKKKPLPEDQLIVAENHEEFPVPE